MAHCLRFFFTLLLCLTSVVWSEGNPSADGLNSEEAAKGVPASEMVQREIDRRREVTMRLNENIDIAERLFRAGEWSHAQSKFNLVLQQTDPQGSTSGFHERAKIGVAKSLAAQAMEKEKEGKKSEAAGLMKQSADMDPSNVNVSREAAKLQETAARAADPYEGNPAATAELVEKTAEIKRLLSLADQLSETGQYRSARMRLDDVIRIDPYNRVARAKIEKIEQARLLAADKRFAASREKALAQVTESWLPPPPAVVDSKRTRSTGTAAASSSAEVLRSLQSIRIPELVFNEKPIRSAIEELQRLSVANDPQSKGLNFVLRLPPPVEGKDPEAAIVSFEVRDVSLQTALKYICEQVRNGDKLRYEVENSAVFLLPVTETGGALETRSFNLPPSLLANLGGGKAASTSVEIGESGPKALGAKVLQIIGVNTTIAGSGASCFQDTGKLVARNTANELNKIEQRIRDSQGEPAQKQFEVETKFLSFTENDIKNFTFNLATSTADVPPSGSPGAANINQYQSGTVTTDGLRGLAPLTSGGGTGSSLAALSNLLNPNNPQFQSNQVGVNGTTFGVGFSAILQLLQNAIGKDLMSAPRVTMADGKISKINISRRMYYPTSYTSPQVPVNDTGGGNGFILPPNPTGFEYRDVGVQMDVTAQSTKTPKAVDLEFSKLEVADFEGFIDYGTVIASSSIGNPRLDNIPITAAAFGNAPYLVPIFSRKSLQSRVRLLDGETIGMGGLISEVVQAVDDKIPIIGDIPLLGRLFRSEASQKVKSNLVIFCTVRVINPDGSLVFPDDEDNPEYAQNSGAEMMPSVP